MTTENKPWYEVANVAEIDSPALLIYPDRAEDNVRRMISIAGAVERLCPHVKTHKLAPLTRMQIALGIKKFKCATIAEAEMVANAGASDIILAYPIVGPKVGRFIQLIKQFPQIQFSTLADCESAIRAMAQAATEAKTTISVLLDIDCGMHRSGIPAGKEAAALYRLISTLPGLKAAGLHVYDGHISDDDLPTRTKNCLEAHEPASRLKEELLAMGLTVPRVVSGGTPTFPIHAQRKDVECSPGTSVLWDIGYEKSCQDLPFLHAALVLTRVISKPSENSLCLDLGHKAIAAEKPHPRVVFPQVPDAKAIIHSEEHLVIETAAAGNFQVGDCLYGIPRHVCPTVALHGEAVVIENGRANARWSIEARNRTLSI